MTMAPAVTENTAGAVCLLLGGRTTRIPGFKNVDLYEGAEVDVRTDVSDLSMFEGGSVQEIYASHVLEHFSHRNTIDVLKEWRRVLKDGGKAFISVPDFDAMVKLTVAYGLNQFIRNLLCGDQEYPLAYHYNVFTFATLAADCAKAGFSDVKRLSRMPYGVRDCSTNIDTMTLSPISVSVEAIA